MKDIIKGYENKVVSQDYKNKEKIDADFTNINIANGDNLPTSERSMYPITFEHNWDYKHFVSIPFLTESECDSLISKWSYVDPEKDINVEKNELREKFSYRDCEINWIAYYQPGWEWFYDKLLPLVKKVNDDVYKFELSNPITQEMIQFTKYKKGGFYKEHTDWEGGGLLDIRKLSWVVNLSDPHTYRGGNLKVLNRTVEKTRGMIHFFPSFLRHQATTVLKGTRYSLVGWTPGPTFK